MTKRGLFTLLLAGLLLIGCMGCLRTVTPKAQPAPSESATQLTPVSLDITFTAIPAQSVDWYKQAYRFENGRAILRYSYEQGNGYFAIDRNGSLLVDTAEQADGLATTLPPKAGAVSAGDGMYFYPYDDDYALMTTDGTILTKFIYQQIGQFRDGLCVVTIDGQDHPVVIDTSGAVIGHLPKGCSARTIGSHNVVVQTGQPEAYEQWLYAADGRPLTQFSYDTIGYYYRGLAVVTKQNTAYLIDSHGKTIDGITFSYDKMVTSYGEAREKSRCYDPLMMTEDALIVPIDGKVAVVHVLRNNM